MSVCFGMNINIVNAAVVPVTVLSEKRQLPTDVPFHPSYNGVVLFKNTFNGELPAADYPKVNVRLLAWKGRFRE